MPRLQSKPASVAKPAAAHPAGAAQNQPQASVPQMTVPFVASSHEYTEPAFVRVQQLDAVSHILEAAEIPAYGFYRDIFLEVECAGGVLGEAVEHPDFPFNIIESITMEDVNGAPIFGPLDGYALLYANIVNGGVFQQDPRSNPLAVLTGANPKFYLRIPQEIYHHNAMGALPNENSASTYKVRITLAPGTVPFITHVPTTYPTVTITAFLEAWTQPADTNYEGTPQAQTPPANGTTQFFSSNTQKLNNGQVNPRLAKVGDLIRSVVAITRTNAGLRSDTVMPNPFRLTWDQRNILNHNLVMQKTLQWERIVGLHSIDAGVYIFSFDHLNMGRMGDGDPFLWWPTAQSSRIQIEGNNSAEGTIQFITNDIAPAEIMPSERYVLTSQTGFHPAMYAGEPIIAGSQG